MHLKPVFINCERILETNLIVTNTEINFCLYMEVTYVHVLSKDTKHLTL